ncbi:hypothetical protein [Plebeiibacterium marinum]|uniref:Uncharacterized protein n=1 Tax=Plebeiibacterium marinum TaxID=2992111 RepID=A0AAE3MEN1_9BACT|nr:hypothetical protein [Plebeiobacterium marinum]MCW3806129.1 hypothetical protein [Plebeiobacterium marinum]
MEKSIKNTILNYFKTLEKTKGSVFDCGAEFGYIFSACSKPLSYRSVKKGLHRGAGSEDFQEYERDNKAIRSRSTFVFSRFSKILFEIAKNVTSGELGDEEQVSENIGFNLATKGGFHLHSDMEDILNGIQHGNAHNRLFKRYENLHFSDMVLARKKDVKALLETTQEAPVEIRMMADFGDAVFWHGGACAGGCYQYNDYYFSEDLIRQLNRWYRLFYIADDTKGMINWDKFHEFGIEIAHVFKSEFETWAGKPIVLHYEKCCEDPNHETNENFEIKSIITN